MNIRLTTWRRRCANGPGEPITYGWANYSTTTKAEGCTAGQGACY